MYGHHDDDVGSRGGSPLAVVLVHAIPGADVDTLLDEIQWHEHR